MSRRKKPFPFFLWHRRIGLLALLLVVILSITGIMLNHTESLQLDEKHIESDLLLNWYNINPKGSPVSYQQKPHWVSQWQQQIFLNGKNIFNHDEQLSGIAEVEDIIAIALQHHVLLVDTDGEVIELIKLQSTNNIQRIGLSGDAIALEDSRQIFYLSDSQLSRWQATQAQATEWSVATELSNDKIDLLKKAFRGQGLSLERVILDLHSGRIFNAQWGIYIMDASAIIMMILGFSGLWIWWSRKLKMRSKKHYRKHH